MITTVCGYVDSLSLTQTHTYSPLPLDLNVYGFNEYHMINEVT